MTRVLPLAAVLMQAMTGTVIFSGTGGTLVDHDGTNTGQLVLQLTAVSNDVVSVGPGNIVVRLIGLSHTYSGDLHVLLTHVPSGISQSLFYMGTPSANFFGNYTFSGLGTGDLWAVAGGLGDSDMIPGEPTIYFPTNAGSALPANFAAFAGLAIQGEWRLTFIDNVAGDSGDILGWELIVDNSPANIPEPGSAALMVGAFVALPLLRRWAIRSRSK